MVIRESNHDCEYCSRCLFWGIEGSGDVPHCLCVGDPEDVERALCEIMSKEKERAKRHEKSIIKVWKSEGDIYHYTARTEDGEYIKSYRSLDDVRNDYYYQIELGTVELIELDEVYQPKRRDE